MISLQSDEAQVEVVECRSNVCRIALTHETPRARKYVRAAGQVLHGDMELQYGYEDGRTTIYALRPEP